MTIFLDAPGNGLDSTGNKALRSLRSLRLPCSQISQETMALIKLEKMLSNAQGNNGLDKPGYTVLSSVTLAYNGLNGLNVPGKNGLNPQSYCVLKSLPSDPPDNTALRCSRLQCSQIS